MAIAPFLAMTASEMYAAASLPAKVAWMACHFSPYGLGLSNLPRTLPPGSLLIVSDVTPPHGHDPALIGQQLAECAGRLQCSGILLDFQREGCEETQAIAAHLAKVLPFPAAISECYGSTLDCPIFLPPLPPALSLESYLLPWSGRDVWLEIGLDGETLTLTEEGCKATPLPYPDHSAVGFSDRDLHCHYTIRTTEKSASFTLWRTKEDLNALLTEAAQKGVTTAIGLYQECG